MGEHPRDPDGPEGPRGRLTPTPASVLLGCVLGGLVLGWLLRPVSVALSSTAPRVSWLQAAALYVVAAILAGVAHSTARTVAERRRLQPHEAVNRLVLAKACAIAGALVAGGYLGYALSSVGLDAELSGERILHSLVAAGGAALTVATALLLERACRIPDDPDE